MRLCICHSQHSALGMFAQSLICHTGISVLLMDNSRYPQLHCFPDDRTRNVTACSYTDIRLEFPNDPFSLSRGGENIFHCPYVLLHIGPGKFPLKTGDRDTAELIPRSRDKLFLHTALCAYI